MTAATALHQFANVLKARKNHRVGLIVIHPFKGVYMGADPDDVPVYMPATTLAPNQLIPAFLSHDSFGDLPNISVFDKLRVHQFQIAISEADFKNGVAYTRAQTAFDLATGLPKRASIPGGPEPTNITHLKPETSLVIQLLLAVSYGCNTSLAGMFGERQPRHTLA